MIEIFKKRQNLPETESAMEAEAMKDAARLIGVAQGLDLGGRSSQVYTILAIQQIKDHKAYRAYGMNWETFCLEVLGRPRTSVDEDLRNLSVFGQEFMETAERISLGRAAMRALRRLPDDARPRVLPSGELEVGEHRVPLDAEHRDQIEDLLEQVVDGQKRLEERIQKGEEQLAAKEEALAQKDREVAEREEQIKELEIRLKRNLDRDDFRTPGMIALLRALMTMAEAERVVKEEEEDKELVLKMARKIAPIQRSLLAYGSNWDPSGGEQALADLEAKYGSPDEDGEEEDV